MGKVKRLKRSQVAKVPLEEDIEKVKFAKSKNRNKIRLRQDEEEQFVEANLSKKILSEARKQHMELEGDLGSSSKSTTFQVPTLNDGDDSESEQDNLEPDTFYENIQIDEEEEKALEKFMSSDPIRGRTLADIIMEKVTEKKTEIETQFSEADSFLVKDLDPRVQRMYEGVREVLKKYRHGKLPKAFKFIPKVKNWEQLLHLTDPPSWSAATMYEATRIFTSNLQSHRVENFFTYVLLPRVRDDLAEYKRLNFHLYQALRKALYKPAAFMKGLVLPLLQSGNCSLREAIIVGSVIVRNSVPAHVSETAMLEIVKMEYTGANSIFLRILLDKKYALAYRVVDSTVSHFLSFVKDTRELPVLWHQAFLTFVQRYKNEISSEQRDSLIDLTKKQHHYTISPEIVRELQHANCRDSAAEGQEMDVN